jgi:PAS domain S-box-containing protein
MNHSSPDENSSLQRQKPASTLPGLATFEVQPCAYLDHEDLRPSFVKATTRYEVKEELGRGGMGIVYRAIDWHLDRELALKVLRPEFVDRPKIIRRFIDESRIMGTLQHPCIAHVYHCGHCGDGRPFHAMILIEGETMDCLMQNYRPSRFSTNRLLNSFARVCQAMAYAHSRSIIHLDLKPGNVIIGKHGEVHIMDWGLARFQDEGGRQNSFYRLEELDINDQAEINEKLKVEGTLEYMSPEQARCEQLDQRTDVFNLGAMLFEILTGQRLYQGRNRKELHRQASLAIMLEPYELLDRCGANPSLVRLAKRCLSPDPEDRPVNATALAAEVSVYQSTALERAQSNIRRFFELSLDPFCIAGFDGFFRQINSNFTRVLGYSEEELLSTPFINFVHPDDRLRTMEQVTILCKGEPVVRFRNRYRDKNGQFIEFEWTAKSIPEENVIFAIARPLED